MLDYLDKIHLVRLIGTEEPNLDLLKAKKAILEDLIHMSVPFGALSEVFQDLKNIAILIKKIEAGQ